jgi:hypothetical protein
VAENSFPSIFKEVEFLFIPAAFFTAIFYVLPVFLPFFAP